MVHVCYRFYCAEAQPKKECSAIPRLELSTTSCFLSFGAPPLLLCHLSLIRALTSLSYRNQYQVSGQLHLLMFFISVLLSNYKEVYLFTIKITITLNIYKCVTSILLFICFRKCAMISAHYGMSDVFDNLVISLCKFTTLLSSIEVRP